MAWSKMTQRAAIAIALMSAAAYAQAQSHSRTEIIQYHDDLETYVLGQVASVTCSASIPTHPACDSETDSVISRTEYGWKALPWKTYQFSLLQQRFTYETTIAGQVGTLKTVTDGNGNVTTLSNWKRGTPQLVIYPATPEASGGAARTVAVDSNGWISAFVDENGYRTCYDYDAMGRVERIRYPSETTLGVCDDGSGGQSGWVATTVAFGRSASGKYGLPVNHWQRTIKTGAGHQVTYFDALWRPVIEEVFDNTNSTTASATRSLTVKRYDLAGRVAFQSYPTASLSNFAAPTLVGIHTSYDALNRVTLVEEDWEGNDERLRTTTAYGSNAGGYYSLVTDPNLNQTVTWYQAFDQPRYDTPTTIRHPEGARTHITRDPFAKVTRIRRSNSNSATGGSVALERNYVYDVRQRLCKTVEPETGATILQYDPVGNLVWSANVGTSYSGLDSCNTTNVPVANRTSRSYDARNRLETLSYPDGRGNQLWTYTKDNLPATITTTVLGSDVVVTNRYSYNSRRLLTVDRQDLTGWTNYSTVHAYDANGHLATMTRNLMGPAIDYAPNALGQPTKVGEFADNVTYHPNGTVSTFVYGNGISHRTELNTRQLPERTVDFRSTSIRFLDDYYDYDPNGNVLAISDAISGGAGDRSMTYDGLDRLTKVISSSFGNAEYAYDVLDNFTRLRVGATTQYAARDHYYCYDARWRLTNLKTGSCSGSTVMGLGYDQRGNWANRNGQVYEFDFGNRLRSILGKEDSFYYDGYGRRAASYRRVNGSDWLRSVYSREGQLLFQQDQGENKRTVYIYLGNRLIAKHTKGNSNGDPADPVVSYYHTDVLGSPVAVTNASRAVIERTQYEPYGRTGNRLFRNQPGYTSHMEDAATGLIYMQQRYYDPQLGLFLSVDPVAAYAQPVVSFNRYRYAYNNPYTITDQDGRDGSPFALARADARVRELEANNPAEARKARAQGYTMATAMLFGPTGLMAGRAFWFSNPLVSNNIAIGSIEAVAGTSIAAGQASTVFRNLAPADTIFPALIFEARAIQQSGFSGRLNYIVSEVGRLVIGRSGHTSLSGGAGVLAAGEARFVGGSLRSLDNASGHYQPSGSSAREAAESAFTKAGFDAAGKYRETF